MEWVFFGAAALCFIVGATWGSAEVARTQESIKQAEEERLTALRDREGVEDRHHARFGARQAAKIALPFVGGFLFDLFTGSEDEAAADAAEEAGLDFVPGIGFVAGMARTARNIEAEKQRLTRRAETAEQRRIGQQAQLADIERAIEPVRRRWLSACAVFFVLGVGAGLWPDATTSSSAVAAPTVRVAAQAVDAAVLVDAAPPPAAPMLTIGEHTCRLRVAPGLKAKVVNRLRPGSACRVRGQFDGRWHPVECEGNEGFVHRSCVD